MNRLFPSLTLETSQVSEKIARGRHTTRAVTLYSAKNVIGGGDGYIADTPGFTMLDFERFDFFGKEDLLLNFAEFTPYVGKCRYTDCRHLSDEDCAILDAIKDGKISKSRHESYCKLYEILKNKHAWDKK
jgi:ribosome biogenesis GTPase